MYSHPSVNSEICSSYSYPGIILFLDVVLRWSQGVLTYVCMSRAIKALGEFLCRFLELFFCISSFTLKIPSALAFLNSSQCFLNPLRTSDFF